MAKIKMMVGDKEVSEVASLVVFVSDSFLEARDILRSDGVFIEDSLLMQIVQFSTASVLGDKLERNRRKNKRGGQ